MKFWNATACVLALTLALAPMMGEAKRLGGGKSVGMQRNAPAQTAPQSPPPTQAAPAPTPTAPTAAPAAAGATAAAAAAAPAKRSWLGPIAGLAAGLGLAALMSHLGLGEAFANMLMVVLLAVAAFFLIRFLMRRFVGGGAQPALATASGPVARSPLQAAGPAAGAPQPAPFATESATARSAFTPAAADVSVTGQPLPSLGSGSSASAPVAADALETAPSGARKLELPEGFDLPAFERVAKMIFIRLQAANDTADLDDLRQFTTPEMFAALRMDLMERGSAPQRTDVERVDATVVDFAREDGRQIVSVRFQGLVKEDTGPANAFDEVWHLVKPEGDGAWAIAGIQQPQ